MTELFDSEGNPQEAFTQEEVDKRLDEAKTTYDQAKEEEIEEIKESNKEEVSKITVDLEKAKKDFDEAVKGDDKTKNLVEMRKIKEDLEIKLKEKEEKDAEFKKGVLDKIDTKKIDDEIIKFVGQDEEIKGKIKDIYNTFQGTPENDEEFKQRVSNAYTLVVGQRPTSPLTASVVSSGGDYKGGLDNKGKFTDPASKGVASKLGLTDEEQEKSGLI